jgi:hypothetical protein
MGPGHGQEIDGQRIIASRVNDPWACSGPLADDFCLPPGATARIYHHQENVMSRHLQIIILVVFMGILLGCSEEQQNKLSRLGVTWLEGDYRVTYADGVHVKSWEVRDGKVTSEPAKGYYYFWALAPNGKKIYVQTPIGRSYIEEIND